MRYIKLYKMMTEWEWYDDLPTFRVFTHLLLTANWKDTKWHGVEIKRGQRVISFRGLAKETGLTERQVRTAIAHLKSTHELTQESTHHYTTVTIENYNKYQGEQNTTNTQTDTQTDTAPTSDIEDVELIERERECDTTYHMRERDNEIIDSVVKAYNDTCYMLPQVIKVTDTRKAHIRQRLKQHSFDELVLAFNKTADSEFLTGGKTNWKADFDWLTKGETNLVKVLEGNYDNRNNVIEKAKSSIAKIQDGLTQEEINKQKELFG